MFGEYPAGSVGMTLDEFETAYAERSGWTVEFLHENGRRGAPCDCGEDICEGWQMGFDSTEEQAAALRLELDEALNDKLEAQNERDMAIRQRRAAQVYAQEPPNHFGLSDEKEGTPNV